MLPLSNTSGWCRGFWNRHTLKHPAFYCSWVRKGLLLHKSVGLFFLIYFSHYDISSQKYTWCSFGLATLDVTSHTDVIAAYLSTLWEAVSGWPKMSCAYTDRSPAISHQLARVCVSCYPFKVNQTYFVFQILHFFLKHLFSSSIFIFLKGENRLYLEGKILHALQSDLFS